MTTSELQKLLKTEREKQNVQQVNENNARIAKNQLLCSKMNAWTPKVRIWLEQLNLIHASRVVPFSRSAYFSFERTIANKSWRMLTDGVNHQFGIFGAQTNPSNFHITALPNQTFTKMGCNGSGCDTGDIWCDGQDWYHKGVKLQDIHEINQWAIDVTIKRIQRFEVYFNECLETLGK